MHRVPGQTWCLVWIADRVKRVCSPKTGTPRIRDTCRVPKIWTRSTESIARECEPDDLRAPTFSITLMAGKIHPPPHTLRISYSVAAGITKPSRTRTVDFIFFFFFCFYRPAVRVDKYNIILFKRSPISNGREGCFWKMFSPRHYVWVCVCVFVIFQINDFLRTLLYTANVAAA